MNPIAAIQSRHSTAEIDAAVDVAHKHDNLDVLNQIDRAPIDGGGITAPIAGFFTMFVDENSDLWAIAPLGGISPLEYDEETGNLYFKAWRVV